ncbi:MAG: polymerase sigma-70 factor, subfamily [Actinomycetota bacterium]|jgi:RNA polymerase sigma-70 factor (ECF subfamily)|nr:polymerase sigma-70 factor, subfamily [Actinomycetota bacterium]
MSRRAAFLRTPTDDRPSPEIDGDIERDLRGHVCVVPARAARVGVAVGHRQRHSPHDDRAHDIDDGTGRDLDQRTAGDVVDRPRDVDPDLVDQAHDVISVDFVDVEVHSADISPTDLDHIAARRNGVDLDLQARALTLEPETSIPSNSSARCGVSGPVGTCATHSPVVGDGAALQFDEFFRTEYPRLSRVLSAADASADDALQEAFTRAARAWKRVSAYEDPAGWVRHVAVRRMLDERRSTRRKHAAMERLEVLAAPHADDPDAAIDLASAIGRLSTRHRIALTLFYLGGLTSAETGEAMGITAGAVRFQLHEARARLRQLLEVRDV